MYTKIILLFILYRRKIYTFKLTSVKFFLRVIVASSSMFWLLSKFTPNVNVWIGWSRFDRIMEIIPLVVMGVITYGIILFITGLRPRHILSSENLG